METIKIGYVGPLTELLKSILIKLGFYTSTITNVFDEKTKEAVIKLQEKYNLVTDGIVGETTWQVLSPYFNGYFSYTIQNGDTIYYIANKFSTSINSILTANPSIIPESLRVGQNIYIPFQNIVPTNISYSYDILKINLDSFTVLYPFLEIGYIGASSMGARIPFIRIGNGKKEIFYNASFHANEWITTPVLMKYIETFCKNYVDNKDTYGYNTRKLFDEVSLCIIPMVNPDGVNLVTNAIKTDSIVFKRAQNIANNYPDIPFPNGWKANIRRCHLF